MQENNANTNGNNGNKIRKIIFNEFSLLTGIIAIIIGVMLFITKPDAQMQQDIALIKQSLNVIENNHLITIQRNIQNINEKNSEQDKTINNINIKLERILTILNKGNYE